MISSFNNCTSLTPMVHKLDKQTLVSDFESHMGAPYFRPCATTNISK